MKAKSIVFISALTFSFVILMTGIVQAQKTAPSKKKAAATAGVTYCDEVLPALRSNLQSMADKDCKTMKECVPCVERRSKESICATIVVQPKNKTCKPVTVGKLEVEKEAMPDASLSRGAALSSPAFHFDVLQSNCYAKGTTLEVYIPDATNGADSGDYLFLWEIDGKPAGHESKVECICGKQVVVRVTKARTGEVVRRMVTLNNCPSSDGGK